MPNCDIWQNVYEFSLFFVCARACALHEICSGALLQISQTIKRFVRFVISLTHFTGCTDEDRRTASSY